MDRGTVVVCAGILAIAVGLGGIWAAWSGPEDPEQKNILVTIESTDRPHTADVLRASDCDSPIVANATVTEEWFDDSVGYERANVRVTIFAEVTVTDGAIRLGNATLAEGQSVALDVCRRTLDGTVVAVQGVADDA